MRIQDGKMDEEEIDRMARDYADRFYAVSQKDHEFLVRSMIEGGYMDANQVSRWYERIGKKLTPRLMDIIKVDPRPVLRMESNFRNTGRSCLIEKLPDAKVYRKDNPRGRGVVGDYNFSMS